MKPKLIKVQVRDTGRTFNGKPVVLVVFDLEYFGGCHVYTESIKDDYLSVEPYELSGDAYKCNFDGGKSGKGTISKEFFDKQAEPE
jgi:hypothetical protein